MSPQWQKDSYEARVWELLTRVERMLRQANWFTERERDEALAWFADFRVLADDVPAEPDRLRASAERVRSEWHDCHECPCKFCAAMRSLSRALDGIPEPIDGDGDMPG